MSDGTAALLDGMIQAAINAGAAIMRVYEGDFAVALKADTSPVTEADQLAEAIILQALAEIAPGVPVVAEEEAAAGRIPETDGGFFLVDPLDGTREFISRNGDFTVNIALLDDWIPVLGVVYTPVERRLFVGSAADAAWTAIVDEAGSIGERTPLRIRERPIDDPLHIVASRSHSSPATEAYLAGLTVASRRSRGSSLKICMVASGEADLYPRLSPTSEWDIAAGDAVLRAAGGRLLGADGRPMRYGKPGFRNDVFLACGDVIPPAPPR